MLKHQNTYMFNLVLRTFHKYLKGLYMIQMLNNFVELILQKYKIMHLFTGSFHLIHIMFDEYAFLVFETQEEQETEKELQKKVQRHMKNAGTLKTN